MLSSASAMQPIMPLGASDMPDISSDNTGLIAERPAGQAVEGRVNSPPDVRATVNNDEMQKNEGESQDADEVISVTHISLRPCGHLFARYGLSLIPEICPTCHDTVSGFANVDTT